MSNKAWVTALKVAAMMLAATGPALAHTGAAAHTHDLATGFGHPLTGLDHLAAMVAVGVWSSTIGSRAVVAVPLAFVALLAGGAVLGGVGVALPAVEQVITASVIVLGLLVAFKVRPPVMAAALVVGLFGIFHGYAHGSEMPAFANPVAYGAGFLSATALLHLAGIGIGMGLSRAGREWMPRFAGGAIAAFGLALPLIG
jgi:urease accessory protein